LPTSSTSSPSYRLVEEVQHGSQGVVSWTIKNGANRIVLEIHCTSYFGFHETDRFRESLREFLNGNDS
jgi:hypothetical protein